jgi:hypothetical protein
MRKSQARALVREMRRLAAERGTEAAIAALAAARVREDHPILFAEHAARVRALGDPMRYERLLMEQATRAAPEPFALRLLLDAGGARVADEELLAFLREAVETAARPEVPKARLSLAKLSRDEKEGAWDLAREALGSFQWISAERWQPPTSTARLSRASCASRAGGWHATPIWTSRPDTGPGRSARCARRGSSSRAGTMPSMRRAARIPFAVLDRNSHKIRGLFRTAGIDIPVCSEPSELAKARRWAERHPDRFERLFDWMAGQPRSCLPAPLTD